MKVYILISKDETARSRRKEIIQAIKLKKREKEQKS
jgi:hypothetical protein